MRDDPVDNFVKANEESERRAVVRESEHMGQKRVHKKVILLSLFTHHNLY